MRFDATEQAAYARDGYVLRRQILTAGELDELRRAVEDVVARVVTHAQEPDAGPEMHLPDGHRLQFSSRTVIQWEWREGSREVRLLEPFTHLDPRFAALWEDRRLVEPFKDALGVDAVAPYTCKLNLKRPRDGSEFPWHQDYPYWYAFTPEHAGEIATVIIFLDDATAANGALRVLPGSHRLGPAPRDPGEPSGFLADPARINPANEILIEAEAGSLLFFPSLLLHRSTPNTSERQRRAVLLSLQPAGRPRQSELVWRPELVQELP
jgi:ectoine hydroxylase